jgi:hypothetical protein
MKILLTILGLLIGASAFSGPSTNQPARIYTKVPWAVGFRMKGTVTNVVATGDKIHFQFNGWFYLHQFPWGGTNEEVIKVNCQNGISATVSLTDSFVATVPNVNAAAERKRDDLLPIFKAAAEHGRELTIQLLSPKLAFGEQAFLQDANVWTITDWDLR